MYERHLVRRSIVVALVLAVALVVPATRGEAASLGPSFSEKVAITPPIAGTTQFGAAISLAGNRLVATGRVGGKPRAFVFNRADNGTWSHTGTIAPAAGASSNWGRSVSVVGATIAITDPDLVKTNERYGRVTIYGFASGAWTIRQTLDNGNDFSTWRSAWLTGNALAIVDGGYCDSGCHFGRWVLYERIGSTYVPRFDSTPRAGLPVSVGVDNGRFVFGNPGFDDSFTLEAARDNTLMLWDTTTSPWRAPLSETTAYRDPTTGDIVHDGWYRRVDVSGPWVAEENCCTPEQEVRILEGFGKYRQVARLPVSGPSDGLALVPDVVLLADKSRGGWRTFVRGSDDNWTPGADLAAPDSAAGAFATEPVASGDRIAVRGAAKVWVLTVSPEPAPK